MKEKATEDKKEDKKQSENFLFFSSNQKVEDKSTTESSVNNILQSVALEPQVGKSYDQQQVSLLTCLKEFCQNQIEYITQKNMMQGVDLETQKQEFLKYLMLQ